MHSPTGHLSAKLKTLNVKSDTFSVSYKTIVFLMIFIGWGVLYIPVYAALADNAWMRDENSHAPFLLAASLIAISVRLYKMDIIPRISRGEKSIALICLLLGAATYLPGRVFDIEISVTFSQFPIAVGIVYLCGGKALMKELWFPVVLLIYLIVWPGHWLNSLTGPLKLWISDMVAQFLAMFGLPVAQSGVVLAIGPYQMLVADACSGINSLVSLTAVGAIYLYIVGEKSKLRNALIFMAVLPIAIIANIIRVVLLLLITYYLGYDAGQGFLHDFAGFLMFGIALCGVFLVDSLFKSNRQEEGNA